MNNPDKITGLLLILLVVMVLILMVLAVVYVVLKLKSKKKEDEDNTSNKKTVSDAKKIAKEYTGDKSNPEQAGIELAEMVLAAGGDKILEEIYS